MTVRHYINEALRILEQRSTDPVAIPGAIERLLDALHELDTSRETTEKVTEWRTSDRYLDYGTSEFTHHYHVEQHKARVVLDD